MEMRSKEVNGVGWVVPHPVGLGSIWEGGETAEMQRHSGMAA